MTQFQCGVCESLIAQEDYEEDGKCWYCRNRRDDDDEAALNVSQTGVK